MDGSRNQLSWKVPLDKTPAVLLMFVLMAPAWMKGTMSSCCWSHERCPVVTYLIITYLIICNILCGDASNENRAAHSAMPPASIPQPEWPSTCRLCCQVYCMMPALISRLLAVAHQLMRPTNAACIDL